MSAGDEEQDVFRVTLPLPPSVNASVRPARIGQALRLVHTEETKRWSVMVAALLARARKPQGLLKGPVAIQHGPESSSRSQGSHRLQLNPIFVAWLMGWRWLAEELLCRVVWTSYDCSGMESSLNRQQQPSTFWQNTSGESEA
jgi:hypothetical protein